MNHRIYFLIFISSLIISQNLISQCDPQIVYNCAAKYKGAIYIRDFNIKVKPKKDIKHSGKRFKIILKEGNNYRFTLCTIDGFEKCHEMKLFEQKCDEFTKPLCASILRENGTSGFDYKCMVSGKYWISIRHLECASKHTCVVGIMSIMNK
jgi:hypothetical protein